MLEDPAAERRLRDEFRTKIRALELELAELRGMVDVLRGAAPPPPAKFPTAEDWTPDIVFKRGAIPRGFPDPRTGFASRVPVLA